MDETAFRSILSEFLLELQSILVEIKKESNSAEASSDNGDLLSRKVLVEIAHHEAAVLESYKDSKGIWTWGIGVTSRSGHRVDRYKDSPQSLERVLEVYEWLLRTKYLPDVLEAFEGHSLTEAQLAAALSFHYNTGGIKRASWVKSWKEGKVRQARLEIMNWRTPREIISRREKERDLFFDSKWSNKDGLVTVFTKVRKPSYSPDWGSGKKVKYGEKQ